MRLIVRYVVPYFLCGARNQSVSTPSSETRLSTPLEPRIAVFTAPDNIRNPTSTTNPWNKSLKETGPTKFIARPEMRLVRYLGRSESGMIATAKKETNEVKSTEKTKITIPARIRFLSLG